MFCIKCGTPLNDNAKFCIKCGNPVPQVASVTPAPQADPQLQVISEPMVTPEQPAPQPYVQPEQPYVPPVQPAPQPYVPPVQPAPQPYVAPVQPSPVAAPFIPPTKSETEKPVKFMIGLMVPAIVLAVLYAISSLVTTFEIYGAGFTSDIRWLFMNGFLTNIICSILLIVATSLLRVNVIPSIVPAILSILLSAYWVIRRAGIISGMISNFALEYILYTGAPFIFFLAGTIMLIVAVFTKGNTKRIFGFVSMGIFAAYALFELILSMFYVSGSHMMFVGLRNLRFLYMNIPLAEICYVLIALGIALSARKKTT